MQPMQFSVFSGLFYFMSHPSWAKISPSVKDVFFVVQTPELSWLSLRCEQTLRQDEPVELVCFYSTHQKPVFIIHENMSPYLVLLRGVLRCFALSVLRDVFLSSMTFFLRFQSLLRMKLICVMSKGGTDKHLISENKNSLGFSQT